MTQVHPAAERVKHYNEFVVLTERKRATSRALHDWAAFPIPRTGSVARARPAARSTP